MERKVQVAAQSRRTLGSAARREGKRMMRFGGVGLANTVTDFLVFVSLLTLSVSPLLANVAGFVVANLQSYALNSRITFRVSGAPAPVSPAGYGKFLAAHSFSLAISTAILLLLADRIGALPAKGAAMGFTFAWNYTTSALLVFHASHDGRDA